MTDQTPAGALEAPAVVLPQHRALLAAWMQDE